MGHYNSPTAYKKHSKPNQRECNAPVCIDEVANIKFLTALMFLRLRSTGSIRQESSSLI